MNKFHDNVDLPVIKPRTTVNNKNEFNVAITRMSEFEVADMKFFDRPVLVQAEEEFLKAMRLSIAQKREELKKEREKLHELEQS